MCEHGDHCPFTNRTSQLFATLGHLYRSLSSNDGPPLFQEVLFPEFVETEDIKGTCIVSKKQTRT